MGTPSRYVTDLRGWELPRADELELQLLDELIKKTRGKALTPEVLGEELYGVFIDRLRVIAGAYVNETIEYWLKGLGNAAVASHSELCAEFPYLNQEESVDALTVDYCVDNEDGTRTRLNRINLGTALIDRIERTHEYTAVERRLVRTVVTELRGLAQALERATTV